MIFVAVPYSHADKLVEQERYERLVEYMASLFANGKYAVAPVIIGHSLVPFHIPGDYNFWRNYSRDLLSRCNEMHVLMLPGWESSIGVVDEIEYAQSLGILINYITC